jgi:hypothetical protein
MNQALYEHMNNKIKMKKKKKEPSIPPMSPMPHLICSSCLLLLNTAFLSSCPTQDFK